MTFYRLYRHLLVTLLVVFMCFGSNAQTTDQHIKVTLRAIGHHFLLQLGDSTSRILPIEKVGKRYAVKFENDFSFKPDVLSATTLSVLETSAVEDGFIVEVEKCAKKEVVYSFNATSSATKNDLIACKLRELPLDCYLFYFTPVLNDNTLSENGTITGLLWGLTCSILAVGIGLFVIYRNKKKKPQKDNGTAIINIGQFQFDQKRMTLKLKAKSIELSSKEADLLSLLFSNENKTLKRAYILKQVWGDDGDYVGRTLDVFISKLRKKLAADPTLKIVNIRGVGYRFVMQ